MSEKYFIIDFDSTFTQVEALDILAGISLKGNKRKAALKEIKSITEKGMHGEINFKKSLTERIRLLEANKKHLPPLIKKLKEKVSPSFKRNREFLTKYRNHIFIISNGFREFIVPIVSEYGIRDDHVFANSFQFDKEGSIVGFDKKNVLSNNNGKVKQLASLKLSGEVYVIGDGYTDYEIKAAGLSNKFFAFTENVERKHILEQADHVAPSLDEFLYVNKMNGSLSYPKNRIKVLLLENVHSKAFDLLKKEGYQVEEINESLSEEELLKKIPDISILGIRSQTHVTKRIIEQARRLISIGAYCIGTNQIDLDECTKKGIVVFNAPFSNTRSVVELAIAHIIYLMRRITAVNADMHKGNWNKSAVGSHEIRGKKLGIIGYGNIGTQLSVIAESLGLDVYYYDIVEKLALGNATKCNSLKELLNLADIVSLHVDGRKENKNLISSTQLKWMKKNAILINLSRGHVIDLDDLKKVLQSNKLGGAAIDVFPEEPLGRNKKFKSPLLELPNVILTPHIGGSTEEAQENIANFVPNKIMDYVNTGKTTNSVNFPNLNLPPLENAHRLIHIHQNTSGVLASINQVLAAHNINILGQYLKTNELIGYVITDIDKEYNREVVQELKKIDGTIKFRVLY